MPVIHAFIDTNVLLAFNHYTKDDIEQLRIIKSLINNDKLKLYITNQIIDEYKRNREVKLNTAIKDFTSGGKPSSLPRCMADFEESKAYLEAVVKIEKLKSALIQNVKLEASEGTLPADKLVDEIIEVSEKIDIDDGAYESALRRRNLGNPPGKKDSLGDQINWECLLQGINDNIDLHIVSKDGDFSSALLPTEANAFLKSEWMKKKNAELFLHEELRPFLKEFFPDIALAIDVEKHEAIDKLLETTNFARTHSMVAVLKPMVEVITWSEADKIFEAGLDNSQIRWIGSDTDVSEFYNALIKKFDNKIDGERKAKLVTAFSEEADQ